MRNWPSENFAQQEQSQEMKNLSPESQKTLDDAIAKIKDNPETAERVKSDFSNLFEELAKNPETARALDVKVTDSMHNELNSIKSQHANGEIYAEEAKNMSHAAIQKATNQRLQIFSYEYGLIS